MLRKFLTMAAALAIMVTAIGVSAPLVEAKSLKLSSKKVILKVDKSQTIKVKGAKKVTWKVTSGRKSIRLACKTRTSVKIVASSVIGEATVQAKVGNKKMICKVTVKPAYSIKADVVLNVTKVDKETVKKVHETLSKGKKLKIHMKGGKKSERLKTIENLKVAVSKYNEYGVRPRFSTPYSIGSYTEWDADSELAGQYKWGLLLVKDIVANYKKEHNYIETKKEEAHDYEEKENELKNALKKKYSLDSTGEDYRGVFKEVTGIYYDSRELANNGEYAHLNSNNWYSLNYKDGQTPKNSENELLPDGYYYVTYKIDGKEVTRTDEVDSFFHKKDWISYYYNSAEYLEFKDKIDKEYEAKWEEKRKQLEEEIKQREEAGESIDPHTRGVIFDEAWDELEDEQIAKEHEEEDKSIAEYYSKTDNWYFDIDDKQLSFSDITFHFEPLKVDLTAVDNAINTKIATQLNAFKTSAIQEQTAYDKTLSGRLSKLLYENKFCDLSSAVQQYVLQGIFRGSDYVAHENSPKAKGRDCAYDSIAGNLKLMYKKKWVDGAFESYAKAETYICRVMGVPCIVIGNNGCGYQDPCMNCYAWTTLTLTNSEGKTFCARNYDGVKLGYYTQDVLSCPKHYATSAKWIRDDSIFN